MTESLTSENGRTVLRMERRLAHPPAKVWRALTEPSELAHWFPAAVELDLRLDGAISFRFDDEDGGAGVIRAYEPPRVLEYTWGSEVQRWEVEPTDDGCLLTLTATYDDRPGSASFTSGWILCLDAMDKALGGDSISRERYQVLHEHFVKVYGLDQPEVRDAMLRFERQLVAPKEEVWARLTGGTKVVAGAPPPAGFVAKGIDPGPVTDVEEPLRLVYPAQDGTVTWTLRDGNGGARLVLTQEGSTATEPWRDLIESLAADLVPADRAPAPS